MTTLISLNYIPPAKGKGRPMPQSMKGQVIVVQAADLLRIRKIIPSLLLNVRGNTGDKVSRESP